MTFGLVHGHNPGDILSKQGTSSMEPFEPCAVKINRADLKKISNLGNSLTTTFGRVYWMIYVALTLFRSYRDLEVGGALSLKSKWRQPGLNIGSHATQIQEFNHYIIAAFTL